MFQKFRAGPMLSALCCTGLAISVIAASPIASAETHEVRLAEQFGIPYLPLMVMKHDHLIEKHAKAQGLGKVTTTWRRFSGGNVMNSALISGNLDFAAAGVGPLLKIWDRTRENMNVKGVASLGDTPIELNTTNPNVKTLRDFTDKDRIALPAVRVSIQAITLDIASAKVFGEKHYNKLEHITVSMKHPDAMAALLSGRTEIDAHFANPPFQEEELENKRVHTVLSSYDVMGGPVTLDVVYARRKFREENPKTFQAVFAAMKEAMKIINHDKHAAAKLYVEETHTKLSPDFIYRIISSKDFHFTTTPHGIMTYAKFMHRVGLMKNVPKAWDDVFFPELHGANGS